MMSPPLHIRQQRLIDSRGRQVLLRGVNLGGDSKVPISQGGTQFPSDFSDHRRVSFVGRPFALADADSHLSRLASWGFNCLRMIVTWEAIAHAGPGCLDDDYLDYLTEVSRRAGAHGFYVIADMHQDAWSRMSGGSGAPGWTFESVGLDFRRFDAADAAWTMQARFDYTNPNPRQARYPQMGWHLNYRLPANGIMWSLFWSGRQLTPEFRVDGLNVQDFLQGEFLSAAAALAERLADQTHVIGFDLLNEPGLGWLGMALTNTDTVLPGIAPTPLQGLALASGLPAEVALFARDKGGIVDTGHRQLLNAARTRIWREGVTCPFEASGIYRLEHGRAVAQDEQAFARIDVANDVFAPFYALADQRLRQAYRSDWLLFLQQDPFAAMRGFSLPRELPAQSLHAAHWYDLGMLSTKRFDPENSVDVFTLERCSGIDELRARYVRQIARVVESAGSRLPTLIGEFGVPFDLDDGLAYRRWSDGEHEAAFSPQVEALGLMYDALDELLLSATLWNYTAGNRNDPRIGDQWNQEDLSIYSIDQSVAGNPSSGGRAVAGFSRPYARAVQGRLLSQRFRRDSGMFEVEFEADPTADAPTELVLPSAQFPLGCIVRHSGPVLRWQRDGARLRIWAAAAGTIRVSCRRIDDASDDSRHDNREDQRNTETKVKEPS